MENKRAFVVAIDSFDLENNQRNRNYTVISDWFDNESIKDLMDRN